LVKTSLSLRDAILAVAIMFVWGSNFVIMRAALAEIPPLLMAALRFTFVFAPIALFLPRPRSVGDSRSDPKYVGWGNLAAYGLFIGVGQFGLIFIALDGLISPGLASLVIQMQVFFTVGLAVFRSGERLKAHQYAAFTLAIAGMALLLAHNGPGATVAGLALTLGAAASWAVGNQVAKEAGKVNALAYVVWSSLFSAPPLFVLALGIEGWPAIRHALTHAGAASWAAVLWQSLGNTMFGYGCWAWLLSRYPTATVAPMALLVPVFGFGASALWLGEPLQSWKIAATILVMGGLALNLLWRQGLKQKARRPAAHAPFDKDRI